MIFTPGPIVAGASGSIGGVTASRNRFGPYFRTRAVPVNPSTNPQAAVRGFVAQLSTDWSSELTDAERAAWDVYASNVPMTNALGETIFLTGLNMYVRSNVPRLQSGLPLIVPAPTIFDLGTLTPPSLAFNATTNNIDILFDNADAWANELDSAMIIFGSRPQSLAINYFTGPYRLAGQILGDGVIPPASPTAVPSAFPFALTNKIFAYVRVTRADGRLSGRFPFGDAAV